DFGQATKTLVALSTTKLICRRADFVLKEIQSAPYRSGGSELKRMFSMIYCLSPMSSQDLISKARAELLLLVCLDSLLFFPRDAMAMADMIACPDLVSGNEIINLPPVTLAFNFFFNTLFVPASFQISRSFKTTLPFIATSNNRIPCTCILPPIPNHGSIK